MSVWEFRIIEGLQEGCAYSLEESVPYKVGSSYDCDILILNKEKKSEAHYFEFRIQNGTIVFSNVQEIIQDHKSNIIYENENLNLPLLLSFLNTKALICHPKENLEDLMKSIHKQQEETTEPDMNSNQTPDLNSDEAELIQDLKLYDDSNHSKHSFLKKKLSSLKDIWREAVQTSKERLNKNSKKPVAKKELVQKYKPLIILSVILFGLCIVPFVAIGIFSPSPSKGDVMQSGIGIQIQGIRHILLNLPPRFSNIKVLPTKDGKISLEGIVSKEADLTLVHEKLKTYNEFISYKIITTDKAVGIVRQILKDKGISSLDVAFDSTYYQISLSGVVSDLNVISDVEIAVSSQSPEVGNMDINRIYTATDVDTEFNKMMSKNKFDSRLNIQKDLTGRSIKITGFLTKNDMAILKRDVDSFSNKFSNVLKIDLDVKDILYALPFKISVVYTGPSPMFITSDGRKIFQGGTIDGMVVEKITKNEIVFSGTYPLVYNLNDAFQEESATVPPSAQVNDDHETTQ